VWDVASARVVAATDGIRALATGEIAGLVEGLGPRKLSMLTVPGLSPSVRGLEEAGVARVSAGPFTQRIARTALQDATTALVAGGALPPGTRA
jgi:2-methylisocitrate lyase-like PEP mutase family enzyme